MKRTFALVLKAIVAVALFGALVYAVLGAAHLSEPAATTVRGLTPRRLWATVIALLALVGVVTGGQALRRSTVANRRPDHVKMGAGVGFLAGLMAVVNGGLNLAVARGGPGSGNGVVGGAAAVVLGLTAMVLSGLALARSRRTRSGAISPSSLE